ncbi:MAG: tripartite tricarboxylate transporter substrate binding protein [Piscinibacter sp.]|uniref:tripartite tricarboxylate transporter substrate binding protein n=1 Tax=Piscinibacter sp. TaxID=1903157 RepID=UPI001B687E9C|nr:tripartite tricarboxylate transporter substrate binding protein [Piscinibacter sp.]MBP5989053.1 tripartite tricarboxylate transporter substrate binding protein [Piscinibacter sp.]MBP6026227.1 tripartite tricarboxylate transporter substrate binding protein [Piscinibacter sp.]
MRFSPATRRQFLAASAASAAGLALPARAAGDIAGGKPITLVVSYPAGGGADAMARLIAPKMAEALGQPVIVDNKPGASGTIAALQVARATPDGATLLLDASSFAVNPALFQKLPYDSDKAFVPIAVLAQFPNVLVCTPGFEAKTVADVLKLARAKPGSLAYASSGNGSAQHLAGALFEQLAKVELTHVPYRGGGPALNDVIGGQVPLFFANVASSLGQIQTGRLRALAVTAATRCRALPEVPTMAQAGVPGYEVLEWNPILAPAGMAPAVRDKLAAAVARAMADAEVLGRIRALGGDVFTGDPARFLAAQQALWARVVKERGITRE